MNFHFQAAPERLAGLQLATQPFLSSTCYRFFFTFQAQFCIQGASKTIDLCPLMLSESLFLLAQLKIRGSTRVPVGGALPAW
jgi:hypothetical protein